MLELDSIANNLIAENNIWFSKTNSAISYPDDGNDVCFDLEDKSFWFKHRNNCILQCVQQYIEDKEILDIGGGNGYVSSYLQQNGYVSVLLEPGKKGILNAQKRGISHLICSTLDDAGFINSSISNIGLFDVVEHIEKDELFINSIQQLLKINGKVFITVPAYNFLWSREDVEAGHYRRYTLSSISELLEKAGFKIVYKTYIFSFLPIPIFLFRTLPFKFIKSKNKAVRPENEHQSAGLTKRVIDWIFGKELNAIKKNKKISFGGTCLIVAQKVD